VTEPSVCLIYAMLRLHVNGQTSAAAKFTTQTLFDLMLTKGRVSLAPNRL